MAQCMTSFAVNKHLYEMWILVCGYKRTGKDTLHCILTGLKNVEKYYWCVYSREGFDISIFLDHSKSDFSRVAFADPLKEHVRKTYSLPDDAFDDYKKDKAINIEGKKVTPRDLLIKHSSDQQWHVIATQEATSARNFVVTDWRFHCEYEHIAKTFSNPCTVRVFRKDVSVPSEDVKSEHELDKTLTDVLLLPEGEDELVKCFELFPQYKDKGFIFRGMIPSNQSTPVHE